MFKFDKFLGDGVHDNNPTYDLLDAWNIKTIIPLNKKVLGKFKYEHPIKVDNNGVPICMGGSTMIYDYYDKVRHRIKWRCPYVKGKIQLDFYFRKITCTISRNNVNAYIINNICFVYKCQ